MERIRHNWEINGKWIIVSALRDNVSVCIAVRDDGGKPSAVCRMWDDGTTMKIENVTDVIDLYAYAVNQIQTRAVAAS